MPYHRAQAAERTKTEAWLEVFREHLIGEYHHRRRHDPHHNHHNDQEDDRGPAQHGRFRVDGQHGHALDSCLFCWVGPQGCDDHDDDDDLYDDHNDYLDESDENNDDFDATGAGGTASHLFAVCILSSMTVFSRNISYLILSYLGAGRTASYLFDNAPGEGHRLR